MNEIKQITEISIERDCFGCPNGTRLVLRSNGTASYTITGKARHGTVDQSSSGTLPAADFKVLARLALKHGFFEMAEQYEDPETADGPWVTTAIQRGSQNKQVFRREAAGPSTLRRLETAAESLRAQIKFTPERQ